MADDFFEEARTYDPVGGAVGLYGTAPVEYPEMSEEEKAYLRLLTESFGEGKDVINALLPQIMRSARMEFNIETGEYEQMGYEAWLSSLDPDQREAELIKQEGRGTLLSLLRGDYDQIPAMEQQMDRITQETHAGLLQQGILPGSSAYADTMSRTQTNLGLMAEELRSRVFGMGRTAAEGVPAGPEALEGMQAGAVLMGAPSPIPAYAQQRAGEYTAAATQAAMDAEASSSLLGSAGSALGMYAASSREFKEDIQDFDGDKAVELLRAMPIRSFKYKDGIEDGGYHIGMITEESPVEITTKDRKAVKLYDSIGLAIAALKRVDERVDLGYTPIKLDKKKEDK